MLNKLILGALTAGAISIPLAGAAGAHSHHGVNHGPGTPGSTTVSSRVNGGIGVNGLPGRIGAHYGTSMTTTMTPSQLLAPLRQQARQAGTSLPQYLRGMTPSVKSPGQIISGIAHNNFPPTSVIPGGTTGSSSTTGSVRVNGR